jgi:predicted exporter
MAAKHDQSSTAQQSSSVNQTATATQSIADAFNQTNSLVYSPQVSATYGAQSGGFDIKTLAIAAGVALLMLFAFVAAR